MKVKPFNFIVTTEERDEVAVGYILDRAGAEQNWLESPAGKFCDVAVRAWPFVKLVILIVVAWITTGIVIRMKRAPGE